MNYLFKLLVNIVLFTNVALFTSAGFRCGNVKTYWWKIMKTFILFQITSTDELITIKPETFIKNWGVFLFRVVLLFQVYLSHSQSGWHAVSFIFPQASIRFAVKLRQKTINIVLLTLYVYVNVYVFIDLGYSVFILPSIIWFSTG